MEEERLLHAQQRPVRDQDLEELVLLRALDAQRGPAPPPGSGGGARRAEVGLESLDHSLLVRAEPDRVGAEPHLVALAPDRAFRLEGGQELGEDPLLGMARAAAQLLARDPAAQRVLGVEGFEQARVCDAQTIVRVAVEIPLAIHREDAALLLQPSSSCAELLGSEGRPRAAGPPLARPAAPACFRCSSSTARGSPRSEQGQVGRERGHLCA